MNPDSLKLMKQNNFVKQCHHWGHHDAVTYGVHAVTYGVHVVTYGVHVVTYGVHVVTYGVL